ncbi:GGDEF domain-containing protein [Blastococcus sp. SYSU D00669]
MRMPSALRARDPRAAARSAVLILAVCATALAGLTLVEGADRPAQVVSWAGVLALLGAAAVCRFVQPERLDRVGVCVALALGGVLLASSLNFLTEDTSITGQSFLAFPVLWAASHLRRGAVVLATGIAVAADALTLGLLQPLEQAATDLAFFGAVLLVMSVMLVRANETQERLVSALQQQATVDSLTGLVNRRVFDDALGTALGAPSGAGTGLVLVDVDAFKTINDSHGHPVGDEVLVHLARILRAAVRADDAVHSRLGGDELAVLLPGCTAEVAARRAEELLAAVRSAPLTLSDGTLLALSISVGVAHSGAPSPDDERTLYSAADAALYQAKRAGRGRVAVAAR